MINLMYSFMPGIKKIIIVLGFFVISVSAISQTTVVTFAPLGFINKFRAKYEVSLNNNISTGTYLNIYYLIFKGVRLDPMVRIYPAGNAPKGFYIQGKAVAGFFNSNIEYTYERELDTLRFSENKSFPTFGGGLGMGYQFLIGKHKFPMDIYLGFQYSKFSAPTSAFKDNMKYETTDDALWYLTGPGSFFNMNVGIGFTF